MLDLEPKEISIDMDLHWIGNASCILGVSSIMGVSFPVQVICSPFFSVDWYYGFQLAPDPPAITTASKSFKVGSSWDIRPVFHVICAINVGEKHSLEACLALYFQAVGG